MKQLRLLVYAGLLLATSRTIQQGGSGTTALTLTPQGGFTGTVALSLVGAPQGVTLAPTSLQVTGSSPVTQNTALLSLRLYALARILPWIPAPIALEGHRIAQRICCITALRRCCLCSLCSLCKDVPMQAPSFHTPEELARGPRVSREVAA